MADGCTERGLTGMGGVTGALGMAVLRRCAPAVALCMAAFAVGCGSAAKTQGGPAPAEVAYVRAPEGPRNYDELRALWNDHEFRLLPCALEDPDKAGSPAFRPAPRKSAAFESRLSEQVLACLEVEFSADFEDRDVIDCAYVENSDNGAEVMLACYDFLLEASTQMNSLVRESDLEAGEWLDAGSCALPPLSTQGEESVAFVVDLNTGMCRSNGQVVTSQMDSDEPRRSVRSTQHREFPEYLLPKKVRPDPAPPRGTFPTEAGEDVRGGVVDTTPAAAERSPCDLVVRLGLTPPQMTESAAPEGHEGRIDWERRRARECIKQLWTTHSFEAVPCELVVSESDADTQDGHQLRAPAAAPSSAFSEWLERRMLSCIEDRFRHDYWAVDDYVCEYMVGPDASSPIDVECYDYTRRLDLSLMALPLLFDGSNPQLEGIVREAEWNPGRCPGPNRELIVHENWNRHLYFKFRIDPKDGLCLPLPVRVPWTGRLPEDHDATHPPSPRRPWWEPGQAPTSDSASVDGASRSGISWQAEPAPGSFGYPRQVSSSRGSSTVPAN